MRGLSKENIWRRERHDLNVDPDAIHVFQTFGYISHCGGDTKKTRAAISDNCLARGALVERKLRRQVANLIEVNRRIEVGMEIEFAHHVGHERPHNTRKFWPNANSAFR